MSRLKRSKDQSDELATLSPIDRKPLLRLLRSQFAIHLHGHHGVAAGHERDTDFLGESDSDPFLQYTSIAFGSSCHEMGVRPSMGTVGDAYDSAMAESFFATLKCELINRRSCRTKAEARTALFIWIEGWYNSRRRHSGLNYQSPINFERTHQNNAVADEHGLPTASVGSSQATTDAVDNPDPMQSPA